MQKVENWEQIPQIQLDIMKRKIFTGNNIMIVRNIVDPQSVVPPHKHPHEQILYVLAGECDVVIEGQTRHMTADTMALFPSNVEHSVIVTGSEPLVALDIFSPIREDFLK